MHVCVAAGIGRHVGPCARSVPPVVVPLLLEFAAGSGAGPVLQDGEAAFMSRVSGLGLESPDRRHKGKRQASHEAAAGKHDDADSSDDEKGKKEHSGHVSKHP